MINLRKGVLSRSSLAERQKKREEEAARLVAEEETGVLAEETEEERLARHAEVAEKKDKSQEPMSYAQIGKASVRS